MKALLRNDWANDVKKAINDFLLTYKNDSNLNKDYVVFDFDNTCRIFDSEETTLKHQLNVMAFPNNPISIKELLTTNLKNFENEFLSKKYGKVIISDWVDDICVAFNVLNDKYGPFDVKGLSKAKQKIVHKDIYWIEFVSKIWTLYKVLVDVIDSKIAYVWLTCWFSNFTQTDLYNLAYDAFKTYSKVNTFEITYQTSEKIDSKVGVVTTTFRYGISVSKNIIELMSCLKSANIDIYVCSASTNMVVKAAVDYFKLNKYVDGITGMSLKIKDGKYINEYDITNTGYLEKKNNEFIIKSIKTNAIAHGSGKVKVILETFAKKYNKGPIAAFMDATGDFNFATEFSNLKLVVCFNSAKKSITEGGGFISTLAIYQKEALKYALKKANKNNDTLYVLQGRDENKKRVLINSNSSVIFKSNAYRLFANNDSYKLLNIFIENSYNCKQIIDTYCIKGHDEKYNLSYGFLKQYDGYHSK